MSNGDSSSEPGESRPVGEELEPEPLEFISRLIHELGPDGIDALRKIELAERDLRISSSVDPMLAHALERAEQLAQVRLALQDLLERAELTTPGTPSLVAHSLGEAAIRQVPRPR